MNDSAFFIFVSLLAGSVGTGVGGAMGAIFADRGDAATGRVLAFAGGVMLGVAAFDMLPEAMESLNALDKLSGIVALASAIGGMLLIFILNKLLDLFQRSRKTSVFRSGAVVEAMATDRRSMLKAGTAMLIAIALHNLPEGMAIGAAGVAERQSGVLMAIVIAIHNVPEGMAIGVPLTGGGVKAVKAVFLASLAGAATVLGALIGLLIGGIGALATGICMSVASGAMLYVTFFDVLPQSVNVLGGKAPSFSLLAGIFVAAVFVYSF